MTTAEKSTCAPTVAPFAGDRVPIVGGVESDGGLAVVDRLRAGWLVATCSSRGATECPYGLSAAAAAAQVPEPAAVDDEIAGLRRGDAFWRPVRRRRRRRRDPPARRAGDR